MADALTISFPLARVMAVQYCISRLAGNIFIAWLYSSMALAISFFSTYKSPLFICSYARATVNNLESSTTGSAESSTRKSIRRSSQGFPVLIGETTSNAADCLPRISPRLFVRLAKLQPCARLTALLRFLSRLFPLRAQPCR